MIFFDDVASFTDEGFNYQTKALLAFIIIFALVGYISYKWDAAREPTIIITLIIFFVLAFSYIDWLNVPLASIPDINGLPEGWLNQYIVFILTLLGGGSYIISKELE
jgi:hypothetical protein